MIFFLNFVFSIRRNCFHSHFLCAADAIHNTYKQMFYIFQWIRSDSFCY
jgi:hypothetical protein